MIFERPRFHQWGVKTWCCDKPPPEMQLDTVIHDTQQRGNCTILAC